MNIVTDSSCDLPPIRQTDGVDEREFVDDETLVTAQMLDAMERSRRVSRTSCSSPHTRGLLNVPCACNASGASIAESIGSAVSKVPVERVVKATLPFCLRMIVALLLIAFVPQISLFLPSLFMESVRRRNPLLVRGVFCEKLSA